MPGLQSEIRSDTIALHGSDIDAFARVLLFMKSVFSRDV